MMRFRNGVGAYEQTLRQLPTHIVQRVLKSPYARLVTSAEADQLRLLPEIVSLHTRKELSKLVGLAPTAARKVAMVLADWLAITPCR